MHVQFYFDKISLIVSNKKLLFEKIINGINLK